MPHFRGQFCLLALVLFLLFTKSSKSQRTHIYNLLKIILFKMEGVLVFAFCLATKH